MQIAKPAAVYFLQVFAAGFALALIRIPYLVPRFGVRAAELVEVPLMLAVIVWASRRLVQRHPDLTRGERVAAGLLALLMLAGAELTLAFVMGARSIGEYVASRDPVSGSAYLASLIFFAVAPALWCAAASDEHAS